ncbi:MAG: hypothetical protein ABIJ09_10925 [Pseudomonadota bacterium]
MSERAARRIRPALLGAVLLGSSLTACDGDTVAELQGRWVAERVLYDVAGGDAFKAVSDRLGDIALAFEGDRVELSFLGTHSTHEFSVEKRWRGDHVLHLYQVGSLRFVDLKIALIKGGRLRVDLPGPEGSRITGFVYRRP